MLLVAGPIGAVDQQNVLPAVAIIVEKGAAGAESLRQKLAAESSAVVLELNSGGAGHIGETKSGRARWLLRGQGVQAAAIATNDAEPAIPHRKDLRFTERSPARRESRTPPVPQSCEFPARS